MKVIRFRPLGEILVGFRAILVSSLTVNLEDFVLSEVARIDFRVEKVGRRIRSIPKLRSIERTIFCLDFFLAKVVLDLISSTKIQICKKSLYLNYF